MSLETTTERGVFIVIEGTDGSGKGTQFQLIKERLLKAGHNVATFDFPQYDQASSYFVKEYLNGKYGSADEVGPYTASLFFALDRYEAAEKIRRALDDGKVVLANRFVGSNMAHQGTKFAHAEERRGYFIWLDNLEFQMLRIPRPDLNIVLRVPAETAQRLVDQKQSRDYTDKKRDIHEADLAHLQKSVEVYDDLCQLFPKDFTRIDCVRGDRLMSIEEVNSLLWEKITPRLPKPNDQSAAKVVHALAAYKVDDIYTPAGLKEETRTLYKQTMTELLQQRSKLLSKLDADSDVADSVGLALLPLAAYVGNQPAAQQIVEQHSNTELSQLAATQLTRTHSQTNAKAVTLVDYWPRNELNAAPGALYPYTNLPLKSIMDAAGAWQYDIKADTLTAYARDKDDQRLHSIGYTFDLFTETSVLLNFSRLPGISVHHQAFTPRYGYGVPDLSPDLSDEFDNCFDLSMQLYSHIQAAGNHQAAQYSTLLGHKVRWLITVSGSDLARLLTARLDDASLRVIQQITESIADVHPILAESHEEATAIRKT